MKHSPVLRSVYQREVEKSKRLLRDIEVMACDLGIKAVMVRLRWRKYFAERRRMEEVIKNILTQMK